MNRNLSEVIDAICSFLRNGLEIEADSTTPLSGKNAEISSLSVMTLVAWCEDTYGISDLLEDDLFLDSLESVLTLAEKIVDKCKKV